MRLWMLMSLTATMVCAEPLSCSYRSLREHLGLGPNNYDLTSFRPVRNWTTPTYATVDLYLYVIIDVDEKLQSFTFGAYVGVSWVNELLRWDPREFCGITEISVPKDYLWRPAFTIMESTERKESYADSDQLNLMWFGYVYSGESYKITSTCKMDLYKFPFDIQRCTLTITSFMNKNDRLLLFLSSNSSDVTTGSLMVFQSQGEWDLISIHVSKENLTMSPRDVWEQLVYTVTIARRPQLYIINFLVPVFVFLVLDLVSYFMNESRGEKLGFKVTILLAISVLLLILHDILPSTHQKTPVIGMFCTGVFIFVACSIVETVTVSFLMRMASKCDAKALSWRNPGRSNRATANQTDYSFSVDGSADRKEHDTSVLHLMLAELQAMRAHMTSDLPVHHGKAQRTHMTCDLLEHHGKACLRLKTAAKCINIVYFLIYICGVSIFLAWIWEEWFS